MVDSPSTAKLKKQAQRLADEAEQRAERVRRGLEVGLPSDGGGSLAELMKWWLENYSKPSSSHSRDRSVVRKHIMASHVARMPLTLVTAARVEAFLQAKTAEGLAPETVNHIRGFISRAFGAARRVGRFVGPNPVSGVKKRHVPKRVQDHLREDEIPRVLDALAPEWRPLFAAAIYTGLRKGEL
jgi:integrase